MEVGSSPSERLEWFAAVCGNCGDEDLKLNSDEVRAISRICEIVFAGGLPHDDRCLLRLAATAVVFLREASDVARVDTYTSEDLREVELFLETIETWRKRSFS